MNAISSASPANADLATRGSRSSLTYQVFCEILKAVRVPMFVISLFVLPAMLFSLFVLPNVDDMQNGISVGKYTMPSFSIYVIMSTGVFATAIGISNERGMKWNLLLRATPMRLSNYVISKFIMTYLVGFCAVAFLFIFARITAGIEMPIRLWLELLLTAVAAMTPFIALGFFLGYVVGPQAAAGLANLIVLPLSFTSGLFIPYDSLPSFVKDSIAPYSPAYHAGQLGWHLVGAGDNTNVGIHIAWLLGYTALFTVLGVVWYRRDEGKTYG